MDSYNLKIEQNKDICINIFFNLNAKPINTKSRHSQHSGFTIVELLIVIVVIGILAAISIVAYDGIQDRANDTTVQSDLRNFGNKVHEYYALESTYPGGTAHFTTQTDLSGINFSVSKNAYAANTHNFIYVKNNAPGAEEFIVVAKE